MPKYNAKTTVLSTIRSWQIPIFACLLLCALVIALLWLRSDTHAIKKLFFIGIESVETENLDQLANLISDQYRDDLGYSKQDLMDLTRDAMDMLESINVSIEHLDITHHQGESEIVAQFKVVATVEGQRGYLAGNPQHAETIRMVTKKEPPGWRVVSVSYPRIHGLAPARRSEE